MRLRETSGSVRDAEIAVMRVGAKTVRHKILVAIVANRDALFCPRFRRGRSARLDGLSRAGFGGWLRGRFFLYGGARCCSRCRLLFGHQPSPSSLVMGEG